MTASPPPQSRSHVTSHVLDAARGRPAAGVAVRLEELLDGVWTPRAQSRTDEDGRVSALGPQALPAGVYRVVFDTGSYFEAAGVQTFYPEVSVTFTLAEEGEHYHVPLLLSPFGYSTYRGS